MLSIVGAWNEGDRPLFVNYDSHVAHSPLQAPVSAFAHFGFIENRTGTDADYEKHRQLYTSMVWYLDLAVGEIVDRLKARPPPPRFPVHAQEAPNPPCRARRWLFVAFQY